VRDIFCTHQSLTFRRSMVHRAKPTSEVLIWSGILADNLNTWLFIPKRNEIISLRDNNDLTIRENNGDKVDAGLQAGFERRSWTEFLRPKSERFKQIQILPDSRVEWNLATSGRINLLQNQLLESAFQLESPSNITLPRLFLWPNRKQLKKVGQKFRKGGSRPCQNRVGHSCDWR